MPKPETGNGHLGSVTLPGRVYVLAEKDGFYFFVTANGKMGWAWNEWFDFDRDNTSLVKGGGEDDTPLYPTRSTSGSKLVFPNDDEYYDEEYPEDAAEEYVEEAAEEPAEEAEEIVEVADEEPAEEITEVAEAEAPAEE